MSLAGFIVRILLVVTPFVVVFLLVAILNLMLVCNTDFNNILSKSTVISNDTSIKSN